MKKCIHCAIEFEPKRSTRKFCSDKCRAAFNRKAPKSAVTKTQIQSLYNSFIDAIEELKQKGFPGMIPAVLNGGNYTESKGAGSPEISYNEATDALLAATSSAEIEKIWRKVLAKKDWAGWQMTELTKTKENQRNKIDF